MDWSDIKVCAWYEIAVMVFQVSGVLALCLHRLTPPTRWAARGRAVFVVAMIGLGVAGALCGAHGSEFSLFAGGTMTFLLIGATLEGGSSVVTVDTPTHSATEPQLVA